MHIILGGAGFIGSHLVTELVTRGDSVKVIDNFSRGSLGNLADAMPTGRLQVMRLDLEKYGFALSSEDIVWHLAAKVAAIEYNRHNQYEMLRANLALAYHAVESVRKQRPKLFVFVSSACVYPADAPVPTPESAGDIGSPEKTNHGYGIAKFVGEQMVRHLTIEHGIPCAIVRFFNAAGPRDYYDEGTSHVIPALIKRVEEGENPIVVWGTGQQSRVFVDVRDITKALIMLGDFMLRPQTMWAGKYELPIITNIGHNREITIAALIEMIARLCGKNVGYVFDKSKPDGCLRRAADTTFMHSLINWVPDTPLEKTILDSIQDYRSRCGK